MSISEDRADDAGTRRHQVVVASRGMEGLREFKRSAISLVLCDLYMPDVDGLDMLTLAKDQE